MILLASNWVRTAILCERLGCLPEPGTLWHQKVKTINRLETALRAIDDVQERKAANASKEGK